VNEGSTQTITWDVANTTAAPVSSPNVSILLSKDGGLTWPTVLVASVPNNGSYTYTVPGGLGSVSAARIMVKSANNIFFNVNLNNFTINSSTAVTPPIGGGTPPNGSTPVRIFQGLMIYPVPSKDGNVYIKADFPVKLDDQRQRFPYEVTYEVYAMDGKLVVPKKTRYIFEDHLERIDLRHVPAETYMIHVTVDGEKIVKKLMMLHK